MSFPRLAGVVTIAAAASLTLSAAHAARPMLAGEAAILAADIKRDVTFLASDANEGRNTAGGKLEGPVTAYLEAEFKKIGLEPGGVNGSYRQPWRFAGWGSGFSQASRSCGRGGCR